MRLTVAQLAERIGAELVGDGSGRISAVGPVESAGESDVTFISSERHIAGLGKSRAGAVIVGRRIEGLTRQQLIVKNVNAALIEALSIFAPELKAAPVGIDPTAKVARDVKISKGVSVGPCAVIDDGVRIGENTVIAGGCKIGEKSEVGKNCRLDSNVVIYHNCTIGNNVVIQANSTIGSTGFGYSFIDGAHPALYKGGAHRLIPHNGGVVVEAFVEIGANCCVDRAKFGNTVIGAGTKIDNFVQIAHNVVIGKCCLIVGQVGIAGSCKIGDGVVLAGQSGLVDNIEIGDGVVVGARSIVTHNVAAGRQVFGVPAFDRVEALRVIALTRRLPGLVKQLRELISRVEELEAAKDDKE